MRDLSPGVSMRATTLSTGQRIRSSWARPAALRKDPRPIVTTCTKSMVSSEGRGSRECQNAAHWRTVGTGQFLKRWECPAVHRLAAMSIATFTSIRSRARRSADRSACCPDPQLDLRIPHVRLPQSSRRVAVTRDLFPPRMLSLAP